MSETAAEKQGAVFRMENMLVKNLSVEMPDNVVAPEFANNPNVQLELRNSSRVLCRAIIIMRCFWMPRCG